uniref:NADH:ubiquinone reductase (H(+)-translocating) n=1 Tax=Rhinebothrium sp. 1 TaxID=108307 RepID=A0A8K1SX02_9CEST|nr:NADH dehydrogenase subunit 5 [Rhinebothrium sp. 1]UFQ88688.1 NADH dehydrogenase subunit 5 [Rhinebothrium sp. 1]
MFLYFFLLIILLGSVLCLGIPGNLLFFNNHTMGGTLWEPVLHLDAVTLSILLMLIICYGYAYFYNYHYFGGGYLCNELGKIIFLFVGVMFTLVLTGDFLTTLVFWEYLGVVSFFLILFYSNYLSLRSSIVTLVSSRFGDVCLFLLIALSIYYACPGVTLLTLFFLVVMTKSAGFPFISWLLEAMRAPTPVSSLVHSSTLVAAGVWFSMRYDLFQLFDNCLFLLSFLLITVFITGVCCFFFLDLKKIVALSTCNNISWCIVYLILGDVCLSLYQLVSHGVSKCLLFMLVGDVMSGSSGSQASNCVYAPRFYGNWGMFGLFSIVLGLSGAPFIGVFFTKHFLLSVFSASVNIFILGFTALCVFLSYFYSFRLCSILSNTSTSSVAGVLYTFSSGVIVYFWLCVNFFITSLLDESASVGSSISVSLIVFQLLSCFSAFWLFNNHIFSNWSSSIFGCDNIVEWFYSSFKRIKQITSVSFFRWDHYVTSLSTNFGNSIISIYNSYLLNIIMLSLFIILMCYIIIYNH